MAAEILISSQSSSVTTEYTAGSDWIWAVTSRVPKVLHGVSYKKPQAKESSYPWQHDQSSQKPAGEGRGCRECMSRREEVGDPKWVSGFCPLSFPKARKISPLLSTWRRQLRTWLTLCFCETLSLWDTAIGNVIHLFFIAVWLDSSYVFILLLLNISVVSGSWLQNDDMDISTHVFSFPMWLFLWDTCLREHLLGYRRVHSSASDRHFPSASSNSSPLVTPGKPVNAGSGCFRAASPTLHAA